MENTNLVNLQEMLQSNMRELANLQPNNYIPQYFEKCGEVYNTYTAALALLEDDSAIMQEEAFFQFQKCNELITNTIKRFK